MIKLTVLDDNGDKAPNFLGNVAIPLLNVSLSTVIHGNTYVTGFFLLDKVFCLISDRQNTIL